MMLRFALLLAVSAILTSCVTRPVGVVERAPRRSEPLVELAGSQVDPGGAPEDGPFIARLESWSAAGRERTVSRWARLHPDRARRYVAARKLSPAILDAMTIGLCERESKGRPELEQLEAELAAARDTGDAPQLRSVRDRSDASGFHATAFAAAVALTRSLAPGPERSQAWTAAASLGQGIRDPESWRSVAELRPLQQAWPDSAAIRGEEAVFEWIGQIEFERGELTRALVDLRHAEAVAVDGHHRAELRAEEARVLYALGQHGEATVLVAPLVGHPSQVIAREACALTGVLAGELGDLERAKEMLQRAIDGESAWDGRSRALADLGITLLRSGEEKAGLAALEKARETFEARGDWNGTARTLINIARYHSYRGRPDLADLPQMEARAIIQREGLLLEL